MAVIHYWIQIENRRWDASPANLDRMTGLKVEHAEIKNRPSTEETLNTYVPGSSSRQVRMFNPIRDSDGKAVDALILRRYKPPTKPNDADAWTVPDDRKLNPWDLNERDPGERGTRGTIPGPTLELSVGDSLVVHFKNADFRPDWPVTGRTHSLHPHGVVFEAKFDGAFPLSPPDTAQPIGPEAALWSAIPVKGQFKQGDRVPPGGTFTYRWETIGWPSTAGVWLYHDHAVNDMDNVERGAIGMIIVHNPADIQDVDVRLFPQGQDPTAFDPALMPGGSPVGSPTVTQPIVVGPGPIPISPTALVAPSAADPVPAPVPDPATTISPAPLVSQRAVDLGGVVAQLSPDLTVISQLFTAKYRIPPPRELIMQLYHTLHGVGVCINGRSYLGNTPTIVAGPNTKMRFGVVGMGIMFHTFHLHGHRWILPGPHGVIPSVQQNSPMDTPVSQFEDTRTFGPANSFVFTIEEASGSFMRAGGPQSERALGEWHMHCHVLDHMMTGMMGSLLIVAGGEIATRLPVGLPMAKQTGGAPPLPKQVHLTTSNRFDPETLTVKMGDTVTWIWDSGATHTVSSTSTPKAFESGQFNTIGHTFNHTFTTMGDFPYQCEFHGPPMVGTIKVTM
jgi:plastocyanin/FtsP/CotA-like multicopper oxidase with cupredoxin domain